MSGKDSAHFKQIFPKNISLLTLKLETDFWIDLNAIKGIKEENDPTFLHGLFAIDCSGIWARCSPGSPDGRCLSPGF